MSVTLVGIFARIFKYGELLGVECHYIVDVFLEPMGVRSNGVRFGFPLIGRVGQKNLLTIKT